MIFTQQDRALLERIESRVKCLEGSNWPATLQRHLISVEKCVDDEARDAERFHGLVLGEFGIAAKQRNNCHEFIAGVLASLENRIMEMQQLQTRWIEMYEKKLAIPQPVDLSDPAEETRQALRELRAAVVESLAALAERLSNVGEMERQLREMRAALLVLGAQVQQLEDFPSSALARSKHRERLDAKMNRKRKGRRK